MSELVEEIKPAVLRVPFLTTFEITTALGFLAFAKQGCTAAVIEVGLGGNYQTRRACGLVPAKGGSSRSLGARSQAREL